VTVDCVLLLPVFAAGFAGVWPLQRKVNFERDAMAREQDEVLVAFAEANEDGDAGIRDARCRLLLDARGPILR